MRNIWTTGPGPVFSYKLRYIVGFWLVEMAISTNQKPTIYRNLYENTAPDSYTIKHYYKTKCMRGMPLKCQLNKLKMADLL